MRYRRKQSKTEITKKCKKTKSVLHAEKHIMFTQKIRKSRYTQKIRVTEKSRYTQKIKQSYSRRATRGGGIWSICPPRNFQNIAWQF